MALQRSRELFAEAEGCIPGGVNSPVRAFQAVGGHPVFIERAEGSRVFDVDGNAYIDFVGSWGPLILGHAHPEVVEAVRQAAGDGTSFGAATPWEVAFARKIREAIPSMEMVRLVNSGTEATMSALRLARAHTGREKIVKFAGCYHGHADSLLVQAGSGAAAMGVPDSPGVPAGAAADTLVAEFNDLASVERLFESHGERIAACIVEPVAGNMGVVPPAEGFLEGLRRITEAHGALLIFDEVMTGFRLRYGGAQDAFGVKPDLTCLGKIIGGGLPVGAYGGRSELMRQVAPAGPVYQAGTLSGNPLAVRAGLRTLEILGGSGVYERIDEMAARLAAGLEEAAEAAGVPVAVNRAGSMLTLFFHDGPVRGFADAMAADREAYARFFRALLDEGVYPPPSPLEAWFVSAAHTDNEIDSTLEAAARALQAMAC